MGFEIIVRFTGPLRTLAGRASLALSVDEGVMLGDALLTLRDEVLPAFTEQVLEPLEAGERSVPLLLVNRAICSGAELGRPVSEGDVVAFVMPMEGG